MANRFVGLMLAVLLMSGCAARLNVVSDYDADSDFSSFKRYAWLTPEKKSDSDPLVDNDLMDQRMRKAVDVQLASRNMIKVKTGEAVDFFVSYRISTRERLDSLQLHQPVIYPYYFGYPFGYPDSRHFHRGVDMSIRQYTAASFFIDMTDPVTERLVWRGSVQRPLKARGTPQEHTLYINETVGAIIDQFPPKDGEE